MLAGIEPLEPSLWLVARSLQIGNKLETCVAKILQMQQNYIIHDFP